MTIEQAVLEKLRQLPRDRQQEVLEFTEFLYQKVAGNKKGIYISTIVQKRFILLSLIWRLKRRLALLPFLRILP